MVSHTREYDGPDANDDDDVVVVVVVMDERVGVNDDVLTLFVIATDDEKRDASLFVAESEADDGELSFPPAPVASPVPPPVDESCNP